MDQNHEENTSLGKKKDEGWTGDKNRQTHRQTDRRPVTPLVRITCIIHYDVFFQSWHRG